MEISIVTLKTLIFISKTKYINDLTAAGSILASLNMQPEYDKKNMTPLNPPKHVSFQLNFIQNNNDGEIRKHNGELMPSVVCEKCSTKARTLIRSLLNFSVGRRKGHNFTHRSDRPTVLCFVPASANFPCLIRSSIRSHQPAIHPGSHSL